MNTRCTQYEFVYEIRSFYWTGPVTFTALSLPGTVDCGRWTQVGLVRNLFDKNSPNLLVLSWRILCELEFAGRFDVLQMSKAPFSGPHVLQTFRSPFHLEFPIFPGSDAEIARKIVIFIRDKQHLEKKNASGFFFRF